MALTRSFLLRGGSEVVGSDCLRKLKMELPASDVVTATEMGQVSSFEILSTRI